MVIGNINNDNIISNDNLLCEFLMDNDHLDNNECNSCSLFPVCDGGCSYLLITKNKLGREYDRCHISKDFIPEFINIHIDNNKKLIEKAKL